MPISFLFVSAALTVSPFSSGELPTKADLMGENRPLAVRVIGGEDVAASRLTGETLRQGTITVVVTDSRTMQPLSSAMVTVVGTSMGGLADANGRVVIPQVPAGPQQIRVERIGFTPVTRSVTVPSGGSVSVDVSLAEEALALDAIVVTGTAGGTQRRAVGNVVGRVSAAEVTEIAPIQNAQQLIAGRTAGVTMLGGAGQVGAGQRIRIRGSGSMALSNDPIIYIDGVRMDSNPAAGLSQRGGANSSRLNDIDPESIESIEIIKGPAAATLYGTEASSGVIQIITKRGSSGAPQLDVTLTGGANWLWDPAGRAGEIWGRNSAGELVGVNLYERERELGNGDLFGYGAIQTFNATLRGGTDAVRYFMSAGYSDQTGAIPWNWDKRLTGRLNLDVIPTETLTLRASMGFVEGKRRLGQNDLTSDPFGGLYWGTIAGLDTPTRGFADAPPEVQEMVHGRSDNDRFTVSFEASHKPTAWLTHRAIMGLDSGQDYNHLLYPKLPETLPFFGADGLGRRTVNRVQRRLVSFDYSGSAVFQLSENFGSETSAGIQYNRTRQLQMGAVGREFAAPPITTVTGGVSRDGSEEFEENATLGFYVQEQIDWRNRVFLTGAVRMDDNSAFGQDFDAAIYPKLSATWVVHEEDFWNIDWMTQFRLRGAFGAAGKQPNTFDAPRLYGPTVGYDDEPALVPQSYGNPQLKPERGEELELGFDAAFFDGRVNLIYTRFDRWTRDAIVNRGIPRSEGFPGTQVVNLGLIRGWGNEVTLDLAAANTGRFSWDVGLQFANFQNRIDDLGGDESIAVGSIAQHRVDYSIADLFRKKVVSAELTPTGALVSGSVMCDGGTGPQGVDQGGAPVPCADAPNVRWGHTQPTWEVGLNNTFSFGPLRLYVRVDGNGGHWHYDNSVGAASTSVVNTRMANEGTDPIYMAYRSVNREPLGFYKAGFLKLREVSATYNLSSQMAGLLRANRGSISVSARNLATLWTAQDGWGTNRTGMVSAFYGDGRIWDVETRGSGNLSTNYQSVIPAMATAQVTVRLGF